MFHRVNRDTLSVLSIERLCEEAAIRPPKVF